MNVSAIYTRAWLMPDFGVVLEHFAYFSAHLTKVGGGAGRKDEQFQ